MYKRAFLGGGLSLLSVFAMASPSFAETSVSEMMSGIDSDAVGQVV